VADRTNPKQRTRLALIDAAKARAANGRPLTIADVADAAQYRSPPTATSPTRTISCSRQPYASGPRYSAKGARGQRRSARAFNQIVEA
jgi:hypothetical protein